MARRNDFANWALMHKNVHVADVELLERNATIIQITNVHNIKHAPIGTTIDHKIDPERLEYWLNKRAIPASRENIDEVLEKLSMQNPRALALKSYGLSLSDQYWLKPSELDVSWESVNFFQNEFSTDIGEILFQNKEIPLPEINFFSPDSSSDGWLEKKWIIKDDKRILVKGSNILYRQEPYNEKIASDIMKYLGINHIPYEITSINNKPYSLCENFINENTELIPAINIVNNTPQIKGDTRLTHLLRGCEALGMDRESIKTDIDKMIVIDYLIANYDRHWFNFGFIRDANTLEWQGFAPIFDTGAALWQHSDQITDEVKSRAFEATQLEQLKLITDLSWYEPIPDKVLSDIITSTLSKHPSMQPERREMIAKAVESHAAVITELKRELSTT